MENRAFAPLYTKSTPNSSGILWPSVTIAASAVAAYANLPGPPSSSNSNQIRISNTTAVWAFVNFGLVNAAPVPTVGTGLPIPPGVTEVISIDSEVGGVSVILSSGSGNVIFTRGEGI